MKKQEKAIYFGKKELLFCALSLLLFIIFLADSDVAIEYMKKSLKLCFAALIPSLFPFTVISELIVKSGAGYRISGIISKPVGKALGVGRESACALLLGALCGFPIGAKTLCTAYDEGAISKEEVEAAMSFCNNSGAAFVINTVGVSLLGSKQTGIALYVCCLISALSVGVIVGRIYKSRLANLPRTKAFFCPSVSPITLFVSAIQSASLSTLHACAFVTFFSALSGCIVSILSKFGLPRIALSLIFGFFEISGGVSEAAKLPQSSAVMICAAVLSWSGLSVALQVMAVSFGRGISFKPYFLAKGSQALLSAVLMGVIIKIFPITKNIFWGTEDIFVGGMTKPDHAFVCFAFFLASLAWTFCGFFSTKTEQKFFSKKFRKRG